MLRAKALDDSLARLAIENGAQWRWLRSATSDSVGYRYRVSTFGRWLLKAISDRVDRWLFIKDGRHHEGSVLRLVTRATYGAVDPADGCV